MVVYWQKEDGIRASDIQKLQAVRWNAQVDGDLFLGGKCSEARLVWVLKAFAIAKSDQKMIASSSHCGLFYM